MSDITLASRYSAENYPLALENLAKRYNRTDSDDAINYSELGFGDLSEDQASKALRFFADIGLLNNPKGANYIPPEAVINWKLKVGETAERGKQEVFECLQDYNVFSELVFILEEGDEELSKLAEQVGGMVGIDEDELSDMEKTIEVFASCGFFDISEDKTVSLAYYSSDETISEETPDQQSASQRSVSNSSERPKEPHPGETVEAIDRTQFVENHTKEPSLNAKLQIEIDATEMDASDLREKLEIVNEIIDNDGE
jgi:hypothetical protein